MVGCVIELRNKRTIQHEILDPSEAEISRYHIRSYYIQLQKSTWFLYTSAEEYLLYICLANKGYHNAGENKMVDMLNSSPHGVIH